MKTWLPTIILLVTGVIAITLTFVGDIWTGFPVIAAGLGTALILQSEDKKSIFPISIITVGGTVSVLLIARGNGFPGFIVAIVSFGILLMVLAVQEYTKQKTKTS